MSSIAVSLEVKAEMAKFGNEAAVASVGLGNSGGVGVQSATEGIQDLTFVGGRIRKARTAVGMSVRELARRIDVSPSHVSQVERGLAKFSVSALYRAVSALEIQFEDLFVSEPQAGDGISVVREASPQVYKQTALDDFGVVVRAGQRREIELRPGCRGGTLGPTHGIGL